MNENTNNVRANDTADAIANLRNALESGAETYVNSDGTVYNPADPTTAENSLSGGGYQAVDKACVAANDGSNVRANDTADAIANLRSALESGAETYVNSDGTVYNPADPTTSESSLSGGGYKAVDKACVAANDGSNVRANDTADAIANLRNALESGAETYVNSDGTVYNPADPTTSESSLSGGGYQAVGKTCVAATQWYHQNPALQRSEIHAMSAIKPDAKYGFLQNNKMFWSVRLRPIICGNRSDWTVIMVYDEDHPQRRWGGSLKVYPVKPNIEEMYDLVYKSSAFPKTIPHLLKDGDGQLYMCTQHTDNIHAGRRKGQKVTTAAACLRYAMRWITVFSLGLVDPITWKKFQAHGEI